MCTCKIESNIFKIFVTKGGRCDQGILQYEKLLVEHMKRKMFADQKIKLKKKTYTIFFLSLNFY